MKSLSRDMANDAPELLMDMAKVKLEELNSWKFDVLRYSKKVLLISYDGIISTLGMELFCRRATMFGPRIMDAMGAILKRIATNSSLLSHVCSHKIIRDFP